MWIVMPVVTRSVFLTFGNLSWLVDVMWRANSALRLKCVMQRQQMAPKVQEKLLPARLFHRCLSGILSGTYCLLDLTSPPEIAWPQTSQFGTLSRRTSVHQTRSLSGISGRPRNTPSPAHWWSSDLAFPRFPSQITENTIVHHPILVHLTLSSLKLPRLLHFLLHSTNFGSAAGAVRQRSKVSNFYRSRHKAQVLGICPAALFRAHADDWAGFRRVCVHTVRVF